MAAGERSDRISFVIGTLLLVLYVAQGWLELEWQPLASVQADLRYKVVSGGVLALYLLHQSLIARRRIFEPITTLVRHKLAGAFAPLVLYLHASRFGYGYLLMLSLVFIGTVGLGLLHRPVMRAHARWVFTWWFVLHVATSASLVVLAGYHAVIALAYE